MHVLLSTLLIPLSSSSLRPFPPLPRFILFLLLRPQWQAKCFFDKHYDPLLLPPVVKEYFTLNPVEPPPEKKGKGKKGGGGKKKKK
jgi:hypothetical protein